MNENINSDFTSKHDLKSGFKEMQNKNFNIINLQPQDVNGIDNNQIRTPLKDKIFNFNNNNYSKTPLNKNLLTSQIANKIQNNKATQIPKDLNSKFNDLKNKKQFNLQLLSSKENIISEKTENKTIGFRNLKENFLPNSKDDDETKIEVRLFSKNQISDSDFDNCDKKFKEKLESKVDKINEFNMIENQTEIHEESDYSNRSSSESQKDSFDLDAHMRSEFDNFIKINEYNSKKILSKEEHEEYSSDISFGIEEKLNEHLIHIDDEITEKEERILDDENILLLNKQDFENFERMKNYNISNYKHNLDELEIEDNLLNEKFFS